MCGQISIETFGCLILWKIYILPATLIWYAYYSYLGGNIEIHGIRYLFCIYSLLWDGRICHGNTYMYTVTICFCIVLLQTLKSDPLLYKERKLYVYFFTNPACLRQLFDEMSSRLQAQKMQWFTNHLSCSVSTSLWTLCRIHNMTYSVAVNKITR